MERFVALLWDRDNESAAHQARTWSSCLSKASPRWSTPIDTPGLLVNVLLPARGTPSAVRMQSADGIVIGTMFEKGQESRGRVAVLTTEQTSRVISSAGMELITRYWGNYLAIWRNAADGAVNVLRDPCGAVGCFRLDAHGVTVLCSYVADIATFEGLSFTIDWDFISAFLVHNYFITRHTGIREITEVLPGERMIWRAGGATTLSWAWNAVEIAAQPSAQSAAEAAKELRSTAEACFSAWGRTHRGIVVRLSGGLDSSIVAALLRRTSDANITGVHLLGKGYEAYEQKFARMAAASAGIDLIEIATAGADASLAPILNEPVAARPTRRVFGIEADNALQQACLALGADAVAGGHGGDALFLQRSMAVDVLSDFVRIKGASREAIKVAYDTAALLQRSIWSVAGQGIGSAVARHKAYTPPPL